VTFFVVHKEHTGMNNMKTGKTITIQYLHKIPELLKERRFPTINYSISLRDTCHCKSQQRGQIKFKTAGQLYILRKDSTDVSVALVCN